LQEGLRIYGFGAVDDATADAANGVELFFGAPEGLFFEDSLGGRSGQVASFECGETGAEDAFGSAKFV